MLTDSRFDALIYGVLLSVSVQVDGVKQLCRKVRSGWTYRGVASYRCRLSSKLAPTDSHLYLAQYYLRYVLTGIGLFLSLNYVLFADRAYLFRGISPMQFLDTWEKSATHYIFGIWQCSCISIEFLIRVG